MDNSPKIREDLNEVDVTDMDDYRGNIVRAMNKNNNYTESNFRVLNKSLEDIMKIIGYGTGRKTTITENEVKSVFSNLLNNVKDNNNAFVRNLLTSADDEQTALAIVDKDLSSGFNSIKGYKLNIQTEPIATENGEVKIVPTVGGRQVDICSNEIMNTPEETLAINIIEYRNCLSYERDSKSSCSVKKDNYITKLTRNYNIDRFALRALNEQIGIMDGRSITENELFDRLNKSSVFKDILKKNPSLNVNSFKKNYIEFVMLTENTKIPESVLDFVTDLEKELFLGNRFNYSIYNLPYVLLNDKKKETIKGDENELIKINYYGYTSCMNPNCPGDGHGSKEFPLILPPLSYQKYSETNEIEVNVLPRFNRCPYCKSVHMIPGKYITVFKEYLELNKGKLEGEGKNSELDSAKIIVPDFNLFTNIFSKFYFKSKDDMENLYLDIKENQNDSLNINNDVDLLTGSSVEKESLVNPYVAVTSAKIRDMQDNFLDNEDEIWNKWIEEFETRFVENYVIEEGSVKLGTFLGIDKDYIEERLIASDSLPEPEIRDFNNEEDFEKAKALYKERVNNADVLKLKSMVVTICSSLNLSYNDEVRTSKRNVLTLLSTLMKRGSINEFLEELKEVIDYNNDQIENPAVDVETKTQLETENNFIDFKMRSSLSKEKFIEKLTSVLSKYKYLLSIAKDVRDVAYIPSFVLDNKQCASLLEEIIYLNILFRNRSKITSRISTCPREVSKIFAPTSIKKIRSFNLESIEKFTKLYNDFSLIDTYRYHEIRKALSCAENSLTNIWDEETTKLFNVQKQARPDNYSLGFASLLNNIEQVETVDKSDLIYDSFFSKSYDMLRNEIITKLAKYYAKDVNENVILKPLLVNYLTDFDNLSNEDKALIIAHYDDFLKMESTEYIIMKPENMSVRDYIDNVIYYNENHESYKTITKEELENFNKLRFSIPINKSKLQSLFDVSKTIIPILKNMNIAKYYETLNTLANEKPVSFRQAYNNVRTSFIVPTLFDVDINYICRERSLGSINSFANIVEYCRRNEVNIDKNFERVLSLLNVEINDENLGEIIYYTYSFTSSEEKHILSPSYFDDHDSYIEKLKQCKYDLIVKESDEVKLCSEIVTTFDEFMNEGIDREIILLYRNYLGSLISTVNKSSNESFEDLFYELSKNSTSSYNVDLYEIEMLGYEEYLTDEVKQLIHSYGIFLIPLYEESVSKYTERFTRSVSMLNANTPIVVTRNKSDDKFKVSVNNFDNVYVKISDDLQELKTYVSSLNNISESLKLNNSATFVGIKTLYCYLMLSINLNDYRNLMYKLFLKEPVEDEDYNETSSSEVNENKETMDSLIADDFELNELLGDFQTGTNNAPTRKSSSSKDSKQRKLRKVLEFVIESITSTNSIVSTTPRNIVGPITDPLYENDYDDLAKIKDFISNLSPYITYKNRKIENLDYISFIFYQGFNHYRDIIHGELRDMIDYRFNQLIGINDKFDENNEKENLIDFKTFTRDLLPSIKSLGKEAMKQFGSVNMRARKENMMYSEEKWKEILPDLFTGEVREAIINLLK